MRELIARKRTARRFAKFASLATRIDDTSTSLPRGQTTLPNQRDDLERSKSR